MIETDIQAEAPTQLATAEEVTATEGNLLCLFRACIDAYVWVNEENPTGLTDALIGSLGLMLKPRYRALWETVCDDD